MSVPKPTDLVRQVVVLAAIAVGIFLGSYPQFFGGSDIGTLSRTMPTPIDPAGYAFAIWSIIFLGQAFFAAEQARPARRGAELPRRIGYLAAGNSLLAGAWGVLYLHHLYVVAWLCMCAILATLITLVVRMGGWPVGREDRAAWLTYHVNLGWISVATLVNTTQLLRDSAGWRGEPLSETTWAIVLILIAAALAVTMLVKRHDLPFSAVIVWALIAIGIQQHLLPAIATTAFVAAAAVLAAALVAAVRGAPKHTSPT